MLAHLHSSLFDTHAMQFWREKVARSIGGDEPLAINTDETLATVMLAKADELHAQKEAKQEDLERQEERREGTSSSETDLLSELDKLVNSLSEEISSIDQQLTKLDDSLNTYVKATLDCLIAGLLRLDQRTISELRYVL